MNNDLRFHGLLCGGGGGNIKSVQTGLASISGSNLAAAPSITPVDLNSALVSVNFMPNNTDLVDANRMMTSAKFKSDSQIRLERMGNGDGAPYPLIAWTVTEFSNVKSKQSGSAVFMGHPSAAPSIIDIPVSGINLQKYVLVASFRTNGGERSYFHLFRYYMKNDSTITVEGQFWGPSINSYVEWQLLEFN